jgi:hypothetical protein
MNRDTKKVVEALKANNLDYRLVRTRKHIKVYVRDQLIGTYIPSKDGTVWHVINRINKLEQAK